MLLSASTRPWQCCLAIEAVELFFASSSVIKLLVASKVSPRTARLDMSRIFLFMGFPLSQTKG